MSKRVRASLFKSLNTFAVTHWCVPLGNLSTQTLTFYFQMVKVSIARSEYTDKNEWWIEWMNGEMEK